MVPQKPLLVKPWSVTPGDYVCFLLFRHPRRVAFFRELAQFEKSA